VERFGEVVIHAGGEAAFAIAEEGVGGEGDDGRAGRAGADGGRRGEAVHLRHLAVHEDEVVGVVGGEGDGFETVRGEVDLAAQFLEEQEGERLVDGIVFGDQNAMAVERGWVWGRGERRGGGGVEEVRHGAEQMFRADEGFGQDGGVAKV